MPIAVRALVVFALLFAVLSTAASALALTPPASEEQMTRDATVIVRVEVEGVVCLGPTEREGDWDVTRYRATMRRIEAIKGEAPERFELPFAEIDAGDDTSYSVTFEPGWRGRVFLVGRAPDFGLVAWNGAISDPDRVHGELPSCGGGCAGCSTHPDDDSDRREFALGMLVMTLLTGLCRALR